VLQCEHVPRATASLAKALHQGCCAACVVGRSAIDNMMLSRSHGSSGGMRHSSSSSERLHVLLRRHVPAPQEVAVPPCST